MYRSTFNLQTKKSIPSLACRIICRLKAYMQIKELFADQKNIYRSNIYLQME